LGLNTKKGRDIRRIPEQEDKLLEEHILSALSLEIGMACSLS